MFWHDKSGVEVVLSSYIRVGFENEIFTEQELTDWLGSGRSK